VVVNPALGTNTQNAFGVGQLRVFAAHPTMPSTY
jgi:hypothetical protein